MEPTLIRREPSVADDFDHIMRENTIGSAGGTVVCPSLCGLGVGDGVGYLSV
jgi:hypothetical protein